MGGSSDQGPQGGNHPVTFNIHTLTVLMIVKDDRLFSVADLSISIPCMVAKCFCRPLVP
jgi:hypothetical protein